MISLSSKRTQNWVRNSLLSNRYQKLSLLMVKLYLILASKSTITIRTVFASSHPVLVDQTGKMLNCVPPTRKQPRDRNTVSYPLLPNNIQEKLPEVLVDDWNVSISPKYNLTRHLQSHLPMCCNDPKFMWASSEEHCSKVTFLKFKRHSLQSWFV